MLTDISRTRVVGGWVAAIVVLMACSVVAGVNLTVSTGLLWVVTGLVPPGVLLLLWHGAPTLTAAQVLHPTQGQPKDGRQ